MFHTENGGIRMSEEQVRRMHDGKGFIAALDQSGGSTPKASAVRKITFVA